MTRRVYLVGVDCATAPGNVGLAFGTFDERGTVVNQARLCSRSEPPAELIARRLAGASGPVLLALDAPLGWPTRLGESLARHVAGDSLDHDAHALFRRYTDRFVREKTGKRPLDVGADLIARTAHAALDLLAELRHRLERPIRLAWAPRFDDCRAIEVYPAGTLAAHGINARGYKAANGLDARRAVLREVSSRITVPGEIPGMETGSDALDAVICLLAARDFLAGGAMGPPEDCPATREGWIWVRRPVE